ncbi:protein STRICTOSIDINE SYNTHASE-LIKE 5-like [Aristolochia californica]|uniref:protein STRICTOSIDINE SYNTHASE-LIKE 5-like n=1 Tax=Aristolochia californica TaxID=171875 RepID=UPI0035D8467A
MKSDKRMSSSAGFPKRTVGALLLLIVAPVALAVIFFQADGFDPVPIPDGFQRETVAVPARNDRLLLGSEKLGEGLLPGPEDLAYDAEAGVVYTGCKDGWVKRVSIGESPAKVENWVYVGGRPLGVAIGPDGQLVVAESYKGLLRVTQERKVELLTNEANGLPFRLTDGVHIAKNGVIYFTDASYKYSLEEDVLDVFGGRPHGRLLSFDPSTNQTRVLVRDLYFANGVQVSPTQDFVIFCESSLRRCRKYHIQGEKNGTVEDFVDNLPGLPDNIHYDGEGHYWIALAAGRTLSVYIAMKYPVVRKLFISLSRYVSLPVFTDGGVIGIDMDGKPFALYKDHSLSFVSSGLKIGNYLYYGFLKKSYISRLDLTKHAAK